MVFVAVHLGLTSFFFLKENTSIDATLRNLLYLAFLKGF